MRLLLLVTTVLTLLQGCAVCESYANGCVLCGDEPPPRNPANQQDRFEVGQAQSPSRPTMSY